MVVHSRLDRETPEAGPCWFTPYSEEDLRRFIQDVHSVFVVEDLEAVVAEGTNSFHVVLESWYDVSALYWYGKLEVTGGCGDISCASRSDNVHGRCRRFDVSAGSGGGEVYTAGTTVYYGIVRDGEDSVACDRFVGVGTTS